MVEELLDVDGLAGCQTNLCSGRNSVGSTIGMNSDITFIVDGFVRLGIVHPDQYISTAAVDDILRLIPVEMVGRILPLL